MASDVRSRTPCASHWAPGSEAASALQCFNRAGVLQIISEYSEDLKSETHSDSSGLFQSSKDDVPAESDVGSKEEVVLEEFPHLQAEEASEGMRSPTCDASFLQRFHEKFGEEGRVQVQVFGHFGSFRDAQVKISDDRISVHGENITSFVGFPKHAFHLVSSSWSEDLRYFIVYVDGFMTMVELVPEAKREPKIERELNLIFHSGVIVALQTAKRKEGCECDPQTLIELIHRTREFASPFRVASLAWDMYLALQKVLGVPYFENHTVSDQRAEAIVDEYFDALFAPRRCNASFWNRAGLIEAIAFMDFESALQCFEAGIQVAEDDATEAMLCANYGQVSGEAVVAQFKLAEQCTKKTIMRLNRATMLDPRLIDPEYGVPLLLKPWILYRDETLDLCREERLQA